MYVGRLAHEKGVRVLLRAMHAVRERVGDRVVFAVVGDGPAEAECRAGAPAGTVFTGKLTGRALSEAYASADLFAFPSITETFGNVVLEAQASGLPVLVTPDGGPRENMQDDVTGVICAFACNLVPTIHIKKDSSDQLTMQLHGFGNLFS